MSELFRIRTDRVELVWGAAREREPVPLAPTEPVAGRLVVTPRRSGLRLEVWRAGVPESVANDPALVVGPRLFEQTDYRVVARSLGAHPVSIAHRDPVLLNEIGREDGGRLALGYVNFGAQVGRSEITILADDEPEFDVEVEVFPTKLDYAADYERLLAEVQDVLTGLAVEYLRSTFRLGTGAWVPQPTHVEWLALLKHVATDLERALAQVAARPMRGLSREPTRARAERVRRADASVRAALRRSPGRIPPRVDERRARPTLDTPEHRWLARQVERITRRLARLVRDETKREASARRDRTIAELAALETRMARLARVEPLDAAEGEPPAGFASLRLLASPGYREAYRALLILSLGLRIEGGPVRLSVKDLSLLYEYWCYLALVRLVSEETGRDVPVRELFRVTERGLHVSLRKGSETALHFSAAAGRRVTVRYNPRFAGEAVLVPQRPDLVITLDDPDWPKLHLLVDAKYRVDASPEYVARYGAPGPPEDAVNVLHRYRDAILEIERAAGDRPERTVVHAAAAFPYREPADGAFRESLMWRSLDRLGVGAIPLLPGDTDYLREWLRAALGRGGWSLADRAIPHRATERARDLAEAASEVVLVGVLRGADPAGHLTWIGSERTYYAPLSRAERLQLAARWVAVYSPAALRTPGAITHVAAVEGVDVVERRAIPTPWGPGRAPAELQAVFRLGPLVELSAPVENVGGRRPPVIRWTSRLALDRARTIDELALDTEPEWRLVEELRARGVEFRIEVVSSRARVVTASGHRVRYAADAGFVVTSPSGQDRTIGRPDDVASLLVRSP